MMGSVFLLGAALAWWVGSPLLGTVLAVIVAALALLAVASGFCTGCEIYRRVRACGGSHPSTTATSSPLISAIRP